MTQKTNERYLGLAEVLYYERQLSILDLEFRSFRLKEGKGLSDFVQVLRQFEDIQSEGQYNVDRKEKVISDIAQTSLV
jgi:hypothetical protein